MNVVIVGCGRVGAGVANALFADHNVVVVDWNPASFERLHGDFAGETLRGNGIDVDVLRAAGADHADVFLALTDGDNRNLMAAQIATDLGAARAVARVYDAARCDVYGDMGLAVISPTVNGAQRLYSMVLGEQGDEE
jgi:trk system potassium uptake protein TrkA